MELENWKSALRFGTWNVRNLFKPGAVGTVVKEIERYKLGVVALQEMRWQDTGSMQISNTTLFFGACDGRRQAGSGFAVNNKLLTAVKSFKVINPRLTILTLDTKWFGVVFVNVHAPTEDKDDNEKDDFYSLLDNTLCEIPRGCVQIILGDFNAKIGREECFKPIIGGHSLHQLSNDNGCRLIDLATGRNLRVKSTMFPHKNIHKGIWRSPDGRHVDQIDHVLVNERFNNSIMDVKTVRGADSDSDHFLVAGRLRVKLKRRQEIRRGGATRRYDIANLNYPVVVENFQKGIEEKLRRMIASESGREVEQRWKTVKQLIQEEAEKTIGKQKTKKKPGLMIFAKKP
ncbi:craniofacial development protein 2-like [Sipha flava]|uniref:Craniofacial development protein 2-like n=1 Tax=Sipha flava TaxID=143950 RepID=A0A8B8GLJ8_9HEMI|nr:craniofacial development protein 2-like [Sipha flava]